MLYSARPAGDFPVRKPYVLPSEVVLSPILVRPVREQLEHDRVIRLLQAKYKRKYEVAINPGNEQTAPVGAGTFPWYPDLVLQTSDRGHKLAGVVEVETAESVNNLEAMSQWAAFARFRVPFHLYLPTSSVDSARRFCTEFGIPIAELWAYQAVGDQLRFTLVQRSPQAGDGKSAVSESGTESKPKAPAANRTAKPEASRTAKPDANRTAKPEERRAARPVTRREPARARSNGAAARPGRRAAATVTRRTASTSKAPVRRSASAKPAPRPKAKAAKRPARSQKRR